MAAEGREFENCGVLATVAVGGARFERRVPYDLTIIHLNPGATAHGQCSTALLSWAHVFVSARTGMRQLLFGVNCCRHFRGEGGGFSISVVCMPMRWVFDSSSL